MAKSKKTKKAPKVSAARILGFCLLGLLAIGAVANVIKALPKEEEPTVEYETVTVEVVGYQSFTLEFQYTQGMTWEEIVNLNENLNLTFVDGKIIYTNEEGINLPLKVIGADNLMSDVNPTDVFELGIKYGSGHPAS